MTDDTQGEVEQSAEPDGPELPVPVQITDKVLRAIGEASDQDQAARLQHHWGDKAYNNAGVVSAVLENHQRLHAITQEYEYGGGLEGEGVDRIVEYLAEQDGFDDPQTYLRQNPEVQAIFNDDYDQDTGYLPMAGLMRLLAHIGKTQGYKHPYREEKK